MIQSVGNGFYALSANLRIALIVIINSSTPLGEKKTGLVYGVDDLPPIPKILGYGVQWFLFSMGAILTSTFFVSVVLTLTPDETVALAQRIFFLVGFTTILQSSFGHKLATFEGPAQAYWPTYAAFASTAAAVGIPMTHVRASLEFGFILAGIIVALIGFTGVVGKVLRFFTPPVIGSMIVLIAISIASKIFPVAMGITPESPGGSLTAVVSTILVVLTTSILSLKTKGFFRTISLLAGIAVGYVVFASAGKIDVSIIGRFPWVGYPTVLAWGTPIFDVGIAAGTILMALILIVNVVASVQAMEAASLLESDEKRVERGVAFNGVSQLIAGITAGVGLVPTIGSSGVVKMTGVATRYAQVAAGGMLVVFSFVPKLGSVFGTVPTPVVMAVSLVSVGVLYSIGLQSYKGNVFGTRDMMVIGLSIILGVGAINLGSGFLGVLPSWASPIVSNGVIVGTVTALFLEHVLFSRRFILEERKDSQH